MIETTRDTKDLRRAQFLCSAHVADQWPQDMGHEVAFAGRSNVGKSSAINAIAGQARLARTSKTPGRTQQIVFFEIENIFDRKKYFFEIRTIPIKKTPPIFRSGGI